MLLLALLLAGPLAFAQEARRVMTMEEAVLGRGLMVQSPTWHWTGDKAVVAQDEPGVPSAPSVPPRWHSPRATISITRIKMAWSTP